MDDHVHDPGSFSETFNNNREFLRTHIETCRDELLAVGYLGGDDIENNEEENNEEAHLLTAETILQNLEAYIYRMISSMLEYFKKNNI